MKRLLRINSNAQRDLQRIGQYLSDIQAPLGLRFFDAVRVSCERLRRSPDLGELWPASSVSDTEFRAWSVRGFERYVIFYRVLPDTVEIVRVLHSAQGADAEL